MAATTSRMPNDSAFGQGLKARNARGKRWEFLFLSAILLGLFVLVVLLFSVVNQVFGLVAVKEEIHVAEISDRPLEELNAAELATILQNNLNKGRLGAAMLEAVFPADLDRALLTVDPISRLMPAGATNPLPEDKLFTELTPEDMAAIMAANISADALRDRVYHDVVGLKVLQSWPLITSIFSRGAVEQEIVNKSQGLGLSPTLSQQQVDDTKADYAASRLEFRSWLNSSFLTDSMSQTASEAGIRMAVVGSLWIMLFAIVPASIIGVGAAVYLEEYAKSSAMGRNRIFAWFNQFIETNIRNLAGVPSIIYGLLGLAIFARALEPVTSGKLFLGTDGAANGRTILSAGLTLGLLILPVIIINAQEAIRAVPSSIREASYGLGATKWQTVSRQVLPAAVPGIMTGIILSLSRAIGETAPLVVVGAAVFLSRDPNGPFSSFTTLPIQIYNWASQPDPQFYNIASAAIVVLLVLLLILNAAAIIIRQRFSRRLQ